MAEKVIHLGPHDNMTPEQALAVAAREPWDDVMIIGFFKDDGEVCIRSSHMTREFANWIIDHAKLQIMGLDK